MNYHFFDYRDFIEGYNGEDMFSTKHILVMVCLFTILILICTFFRKINHKKIDLYLKIMAIIMPIHEIAKITWETYWDLKFDCGFNIAGLLPLYTCSMFFWILPFAAFGNGKVRQYALAFLTTTGIFAGLTNFVYLNILNTYPLFTYAGISSISYHFWMVFTGIFLLSTGYYRPTIKDIPRSMICIWIFSLIVIPADYIIYNYNTWVDYMLYMRGANMPVISDIRDFFQSINFKFGFTLFMATFGYGLVTILTFGIYKLFGLVSKQLPKGKPKKARTN